MVRIQSAPSSLLFLLFSLLVSISVPNRADAIEVLVPNGGLRWTAGETREIQWNSSAEGPLHVEWSPNGGELFWLTIEAEAPNTGSYLWLVPNIRTRRAFVRITELSTSESDSSDSFFVIDHIPTEQSEGHLYLSAVPDMQVAGIDVVPGVEFDWYVVTDIDFGQTPNASGLSGWEASINVPPEIVVTSRALFPAGAIDVVTGITNLAVGTGECLEADRMPFALVRYTSLLLSAQTDLALTLEPSTPSSTDPPEVPAWAGCGATGGLWPYPLTSNLIVNPTTGVPVPTPGAFALLQNRPNPFNPKTTIYFQLPAPMQYKLDILDARGRLVRTFPSQGTEGLNHVVWDGKDGTGNVSASGIYYYRLQAGHSVQTRRMVLSK